MSVICRIPASPAKSLIGPCRNARFARALPGACGAARQQPQAGGIVVLAAGQTSYMRAGHGLAVSIFDSANPVSIAFFPPFVA